MICIQCSILSSHLMVAPCVTRTLGSAVCYKGSRKTFEEAATLRQPLSRDQGDCTDMIRAETVRVDEHAFSVGVELSITPCYQTLSEPGTRWIS